MIINKYHHFQNQNMNRPEKNMNRPLLYIPKQQYIDTMPTPSPYTVVQSPFKFTIKADKTTQDTKPHIINKANDI